MPLEKLARSPILNESLAPVQSIGAGRYLDSVGFVIYDTAGYCVIQLDGSRVIRNTAVNSNFAHKHHILDVARPDRMLGCRTTTTFIVSANWNTGFDVREIEPRTGQYRYVDGAIVEVVNITTPPSQNIPFALLPDRMLFTADLGPIGTNADGRHWIVSFPLDPEAPQVWTYEFALPAVAVFSLAACPSDVPDCIWLRGVEAEIDQNGTLPDEFRIGLYNYVTKQFVRWAVIPDENEERTYLLGWSDTFRVLLARAHAGATGYGGIYVMTTRSSPVSISAPERVEGSRIEVVSISQTNPAIITVRGSLLQWLEQNGAGDGSSVFLSESQLINDYQAGTPLVQLGRSYPLTLVDDSRFSVPFDGTARRTFSSSACIPKHTNWTGVKPEQAAYMQVLFDTLVVGTQMEFVAATPSDHPILAETATVTRDEPLFYGNANWLDLDMTGWPAITALTYQITGPGGVLPINNVYAVCDSTEVGITSVDLAGANPVFTVDDPDWLDTLDITGTFPATVLQQGLSFANTYATPSATRVSANQFSIPLSSGSITGTLKWGSVRVTPKLPPRGFKVRSRVTTDFGEPCEGRVVSWTATAGTFLQTPTVTDADGYAYAEYLPPVGASGDYTITASVETP